MAARFPFAEGGWWFPAERLRKGLERFGGREPGIAGRLRHQLLAKDEGWAAVYFDVLSRVSQASRLTSPIRSRLAPFL